VDATLLILHSGNYEYVAVRHRETQTLFLSDIYQPHELKEPGYGRLHVGIYISAVKDALDRFNKLPKDTNPPSPPRGDDEDGSEDGGDGDGGSAKRSDDKGKGRDQGGNEDRGRGGKGGKGRRGSGRRRKGGSHGHSASRVSGNKMAGRQFAVCQLYMSGLMLLTCRSSR
jgi:hypothetical protein